MKKISLFASLLVLTFISAAPGDEKPDNAVLDTLCGLANRSLEVCLAEVKLSSNKYLVLRPFEREVQYLPVITESFWPGGQSFEAYRATYSSIPERHYGLEDKYELRLSVNPQIDECKATLTVNGGNSRVFTMERMSYSQEEK